MPLSLDFISVSFIAYFKAWPFSEGGTAYFV